MEVLRVFFAFLLVMQLKIYLYTLYYIKNNINKLNFPNISASKNFFRHLVGPSGWKGGRVGKFISFVLFSWLFSLDVN
jgi:hypothetical protein